tara:strand:+ start:766 stop:1116 length:351 start_codon:yes stop_codon:yes gene_type:complete
MDIDNICDAMSNVKVIDHINLKLINDINLIINEIVNAKTFDIDLYEICISCGHSLTWDQEYFIYTTDLNWLRNKGQQYFVETLHSKMPISNHIELSKVYDIYNKLYELFCLQVITE